MHLVNKTNLVHNIFLIYSYLSASINILRESCAPSWFHLEDYTEMHGQQNRNYNAPLSSWVEANGLD